MTWEIVYHKDVDNDLKSVGPAAAKRIMLTIDKNLLLPLKNLDHHYQTISKASEN